MGPQDPKDVTRAIARDLSALAGELSSIKGDTEHWLEGAEYEALRQRLEIAHAAAEAALVEARRRAENDARILEVVERHGSPERVERLKAQPGQLAKIRDAGP